MGINNIHSNSIIPIRASKKHKLTDDEKWYNNEISKVRIVIEHVNAFIKKFKITSTRYRNRRKNFKLYMSLICGIYNFETANLQFTDRPIHLKGDSKRRVYKNLSYWQKIKNKDNFPRFYSVINNYNYTFKYTKESCIKDKIKSIV